MNTSQRTDPLGWALGACVVAGLGLGSTAYAAAPTHFSYDFDGEFVDTESCAAWGFDLHVVQHEHGDVTVFLDRSGNFARGVNHTTADFTISANGVALGRYWTTQSGRLGSLISAVRAKLGGSVRSGEHGDLVT